MTEPTEYVPTLEQARERYVDSFGLFSDPRYAGYAAAEFDRMIAAVRVDEREQCAQIAESYGKNGLGDVPYNQTAIAAAIRGRQQ